MGSNPFKHFEINFERSEMKIPVLGLRSLLRSSAAFMLVASLLLVGCSQSEVDSTASSKTTEAAYDASGFVLASEPEGGMDVIAARDSVEDQADVVIVGRIGGGLNPWVEGRAAFQIVDPSLLACSDEKEDGEPCSCKTPWDYCCESDKLPKAMALVQFVEADGTTVKADARKAFNLKELQTVVVKGKAKRDDVGNLTVLATGMFVRP
jgi:hypothetical protein